MKKQNLIKIFILLVVCMLISACINPLQDTEKKRQYAEGLEKFNYEIQERENKLLVLKTIVGYGAENNTIVDWIWLDINFRQQIDPNHRLDVKGWEIIKIDEEIYEASFTVYDSRRPIKYTFEVNINNKKIYSVNENADKVLRAVNHCIEDGCKY